MHLIVIICMFNFPVFFFWAHKNPAQFFMTSAANATQKKHNVIIKTLNAHVQFVFYYLCIV